MSDMKEAAVQIRVNADGKVTLSIDETLRRSVITACSRHSAALLTSQENTKMKSSTH